MKTLPSQEELGMQIFSTNIAAFFVYVLRVEDNTLIDNTNEKKCFT